MSYQPTLTQLQYLTALHRYGHFGRAADACFVTQSTLSAGLRELETRLGVVLVERNRRVVRFTPLGEAVVARAHSVLREAEALTDLARGAGRPLAGPLRLSVIPTIAPFLLPRLLPRLRARFPELKLFLREEQSGAACEALHRGQADAVLLALPFQCGDVEQMALFDDPIRLAFHPEDLPDAPPEVEPAALDGERLLLLEEGHCLKDHALAACSRATLRPDATVLGTSLHTLVQMADNRIGMTLLPQMAIDGGILRGTGVETRPLRSPDARRAISLVWRQRSPRADEFRMLGAALAESAPPHRAEEIGGREGRGPGLGGADERDDAGVDRGLAA